MIDKLSDRLSAAWTILNEHDDKLGVCDVINDAEAVVKAWENAPIATAEAMTGDCEIIGMDLIYAGSGETNFRKLFALDGKRVKLMEIDDEN